MPPRLASHRYTFPPPRYHHHFFPLVPPLSQAPIVVGRLLGCFCFGFRRGRNRLANLS